MLPERPGNSVCELIIMGTDLRPLVRSEQARLRWELAIHERAAFDANQEESLAETQHLSEVQISQKQERRRHCGSLQGGETKMPVFCIAQLPQENVHLFLSTPFYILSGI